MGSNERVVMISSTQQLMQKTEQHQYRNAMSYLKKVDRHQNSLI